MTETSLSETSEMTITDTDSEADIAQLTAFPAQVTADEAASLLASTDDDITHVSAEELLYYPYRIVEFRVQVEALFNSFDQVQTCGVDLCNGKALLVDDDPGSTVTSVPSKQVLPAEEDGNGVIEIAHSYVVEAVHRRLTIGRSMEVTKQKSYLRYRPFHLVKCQTVNGAQLTYIVDSITSGFHRVYQ